MLSDGDYKVGIKLADSKTDSTKNSNNSNNSNSNNNNNNSSNDTLDYALLNANNNNRGYQDDAESLIPPKGVITLTLYGEKGKSDAFELDLSSEDLSVSSCSCVCLRVCVCVCVCVYEKVYKYAVYNQILFMQIHAGDIGRVYKIRVTSGEESGPDTKWQIQEVIASC